VLIDLSFELFSSVCCFFSRVKVRGQISSLTDFILSFVGCGLDFVCRPCAPRFSILCFLFKPGTPESGPSLHRSVLISAAASVSRSRAGFDFCVWFLNQKPFLGL
jgi:hypothetical protein